MRSSYWTHPKTSRASVIVALVVALGGTAAVERIRREPDDEVLAHKAAAARLAARSMQAIKSERLRRGIPIDPEVDPAQSGLIGVSSSETTSNSGQLSAKQTAVNPNWAAAVVDMLDRAGVEKGDCVAVGLSGSFPGLNVCTCAALETMGVRPILIASAAGSRWGANHPDLLWLDMEKLLHDEGLIGFRSVAASLGGQHDQALGMSAEGRRMLRETIDETGVPFLAAGDYHESLRKRLEIYAERAAGEPIAAYINIGGGTVSVGTYVSKAMFRPGLNTQMPEGDLPVEGVMSHFLGRGVPVIHLSGIESLALRYDLPLQPAELPPVAVAPVEAHRDYNKWLASAVLAAVVATLYLPVAVSWTRSRRRAFYLFDTGMD